MSSAAAAGLIGRRPSVAGSERVRLYITSHTHISIECISATIAEFKVLSNMRTNATTASCLTASSSVAATAAAASAAVFVLFMSQLSFSHGSSGSGWRGDAPPRKSVDSQRRARQQQVKREPVSCSCSRRLRKGAASIDILDSSSLLFAFWINEGKELKQEGGHAAASVSAAAAAGSVALEQEPLQPQPEEQTSSSSEQPSDDASTDWEEDLKELPDETRKIKKMRKVSQTASAGAVQQKQLQDRLQLSSAHCC